MSTAKRTKPTAAVLAVVAGTAVLALFAALKAGALPELPGKVALGFAIPTAFGASLLAMRPSLRPRRSYSLVGPRRADPAPTADRGVQTGSEVDRVRSWRGVRLAALGVDEETALVLAAEPAFTVHDLERLLKAGCPLATALRILWPCRLRRDERLSA